MYILKINCNMNTLIELYVKGSPMSMILQNMIRMADSDSWKLVDVGGIALLVSTIVDT